MKINISLNIKHLVNHYFKGQKEFAEQFDLIGSSVSAYVHNRSYPKLETIVEIANHFDLSLDELIVGDMRGRFIESGVSDTSNNLICKVQELESRLLEKQKIIDIQNDLIANYKENSEVNKNVRQMLNNTLTIIEKIQKHG
jgi:transcriptional regulator with XRE-family HTH domain